MRCSPTCLGSSKSSKARSTRSWLTLKNLMRGLLRPSVKLFKLINCNKKGVRYANRLRGREGGRGREAEREREAGRGLLYRLVDYLLCIRVQVPGEPLKRID
jgi:hypothetical protein